MPSDRNPGHDAVWLQRVSHRYGEVTALDDISLTFPVGSDTAIIGPDGVGKSTLLALAAGARKLQSGRIDVLGADMGAQQEREGVASRIAFMPQGLGRNLYPSLSIRETLDFFADLHALTPDTRESRCRQLLIATGLEPFGDRPAGKLSGGMRQKLSLCCALVHDPDVLILDEPTTGIDPLSRRQFWRLIERIRVAWPQMTLIVATAYMDEAERFSRLVVMDTGRILASGPRAEVLATTGASTVEAAFVSLHPPQPVVAMPLAVTPDHRHVHDQPCIVAKGLTRRFGDFVAVDDVSFTINRGEIFGFLGSNGCGKTTTMKMLTGLLPATSGHATLLGRPVDAADLETRRRVGYLSQSFSLYGELTVRGNLALHARLFRLTPAEQALRIEEALERFELRKVADEFPEALPLGIRQRLQLAVACLHQPEVLILDEPTAGVDPATRDSFWRLLTDLAHRDQVTIFVSTHVLNEAGRCDRLSFMHAGKVLAIGTPEDLTQQYQAKTLEDAFVVCLEGAAGPAPAPDESVALAPHPERISRNAFRDWLTWVRAFCKREGREILRDPIRLGFALLAPLVLMLTFARGISFDIESLPFAILDRDQSAESQSLALHLSGSRYFSERQPARSDAEADRRLQAGDAALVVEIPPGFGRDLLKGHQPTLSLWLDGANPARANTARGYAEGVAQAFISSVTRDDRGGKVRQLVTLEPRFLYNQDFRSVFAMTPGVIMFLTMLIVAMMTALSVTREREIGSIVNLAVSPASTGAFLVGKFLPYVGIGFLTFLMMVALAVVGLDVPVKGSFLALLLGGFLYVVTAAAFGILVSTFIRSQVAAIFACALLTLLPALNFSGFLQPVSNLSPLAQSIGLLFPSSWFQQISIGVFAKGLPFSAFGSPLAALALFPVVYLLLASVMLDKQER